MSLLLRAPAPPLHLVESTPSVSSEECLVLHLLALLEQLAGLEAMYAFHQCEKPFGFAHARHCRRDNAVRYIRQEIEARCSLLQSIHPQSLGCG